MERNKRETRREDNREERTVRGREMEGVRERQAEVERTAEHGRSQREECERKLVSRSQDDDQI